MRVACFGGAEFRTDATRKRCPGYRASASLPTPPPVANGANPTLTAAAVERGNSSNPAALSWLPKEAAKAGSLETTVDR